MVWQLLIGLGTVAAASLAWLLLRALRRSEHTAAASAGLLRHHVEPYLRRRSSESGAPLPPPTAPSQTLTEVVQVICAVADTLTAQEKGQLAPDDTLDVAISETVPLSVPTSRSERT